MHLWRGRKVASVSIRFKVHQVLVYEVACTVRQVATFEVNATHNHSKCMLEFQSL